MAAELVYSKLDKSIIKRNLKNLSLHPMKQSHVYLELDVNGTNIDDITGLESYTNLMHVDISKNAISNIDILRYLPYLINLKASLNKITSCLSYTFVKSDSDDENRTSLLSHVDLSYNQIKEILNLSYHPFIEDLNLSNNMISSTNGFSSLQHLKVINSCTNVLFL